MMSFNAIIRWFVKKNQSIDTVTDTVAVHEDEHNAADHSAWKYVLKSDTKAIDTHLTSEFWDDAQMKVEDPKRVFRNSFRGGSLW